MVAGPFVMSVYATLTHLTYPQLFIEFRQRAAKCLGFAKVLHRDLEIASEYVTQSSKINTNSLFDILGMAHSLVLMAECCAERSGHTLLSSVEGRREPLLGATTFVFVPDQCAEVSMETYLVELIASPLGADRSDHNAWAMGAYILFVHAPSDYWASESEDTEDEDEIREKVYYPSHRTRDTIERMRKLVKSPPLTD